MLGMIPQSAPFEKVCMIWGLPLFSIYTQTRTRAPARGMTETKPPADGSFLAMPTAEKIIKEAERSFDQGLHVVRL